MGAEAVVGDHNFHGLAVSKFVALHVGGHVLIAMLAIVSEHQGQRLGGKELLEALQRELVQIEVDINDPRFLGSAG